MKSDQQIVGVVQRHGLWTISAHVPFTTAGLVIGVWKTIKEAADKDGVTVKLRGRQSAGHKEAAADHRVF